MINILLSGCLGRMGQAICALAADRTDCRIAAGLDCQSDDSGAFPIYADTGAVQTDYDVLIDFSHPSALSGIAALTAQTGKPVVIATTGLNDSHQALLDVLSRSAAVFTAANMSLGVNILIRLAKDAARALYPDFNIEIVEAHHNRKLDAPSGTALMIADGIRSALNDPDVFYRTERASIREPRSANEIGISAIRGGTIVGEHDIIFAGHNEVLTLSHSAQSREIFAQGALSAARFLAGQPAGWYSMDDLIAHTLKTG